MAGVADLLLGAHDPLGDGRLRHQVGPGDLRHLEPAEQAQGEGGLRERRERRVAAGEDQPELVVAHRSHLLGLVGLVQQQRLGVAGLAGGLPAQPVDGPVAGGGDDPGAGVGRQGRPISAGPPRTRPGPPPRRARCRRGGGSGWPRTGRTPPGRRSPGPCRRPVRAGSSSKGRTSTGSCRPRALLGPGQRLVEVVAADHPEPAELLLRLGERPVGHGGRAALDPDDGGAVDGSRPPPKTQTPAVCSSALTLSTWAVAVCISSSDGVGAPSTAVHGEQVLLHGHSFVGYGWRMDGCQAGSRRAIAGMTIAAATRWVSISSVLVAGRRPRSRPAPATAR